MSGNCVSLLHKAFSFFNEMLFEDSLPECHISLQRSSGVAGYFWSNAMKLKEGNYRKHEIALNPTMFSRSDRETLSTLVHEMVHLQQKVYGKFTPEGNVHNREWATMMIAIGLIPSTTGKPGGELIGGRMSHYIEPDGKYSRAYSLWEMRNPPIELFSQPLMRLVKVKPKTSKQLKCPTCKLKVRVKVGHMLICGSCHRKMKLVRPRSKFRRSN